MMTTKKLGKRSFHFTVSGNNLHDVAAEYERLSFADIAGCGLCGSDNLDLTSRVSQGKFKYVSVRCLACRASVDFGKRQDDDETYFLRKKEGGAPGELDWRAFNKDAA